MKSKLIFFAVALALVVVGCKSSTPTPDAGAQKYMQQLREAVSGTVEDPGRKDRMLALVGQMESVEKGFNQDVSAFVGSFRLLNTNYNTPRSEFDALFQNYDGQRIQARDRFLALHFQLTALATAEEWKRIGKVEMKMYEELLKPREQQEVAS